MKKRKNKVNIFKLMFYTATVILTTIYIVFRIFFTIPTNLGIIALTTAILVLLIEIWEAVDFFIYYLNILCVNKKSPKIPSLSNIKKYPDIDVLIATYNEHETLLEKTIQACKDLKYPDNSKIHIYVCDDGNRKAIKELAERMNINYITRLSNKNAKAGNYNHALQLINSPYVATFDADMAPTPNFLLTTLPFFFENKEKVGFVQLPQSFVNPDIFQYRFRLFNKIPFEQDYFYHSIQIAKNETNSAIYCGTNALISRKALNDCNGFALGTISEDIATGMLIESKGYEGIAIENVEAYGIAVNDLTGFVKQRSRWARGCIQILKKYNIMGNKGLTFRQKLEYLSSISYWFFGIRRMVYILTPLLFSLFGIIIVDCDLLTFICLWLPAYLMKRFALDILEDNRRSSTWNKIYETIMAPTLAKEAIKELFGFGKTNFDVTPKFGPSNKLSKTNIKMLLVHLLLLILNISGLVMCIYRIQSTGIIVYILSLLWLISNIFYLTVSVKFDLRYKTANYKKFEPNKIKRYNNLSSLLIWFK